mmetsp:Transcript_48306/g.115916  ORF Transcript_48306/g.115916 Transcript_48306/m.115916 type:complete len:162 (-) Transcript_48306:5-490(-)
MHAKPEIAKDTTTAGPAYKAAACPDMTKMPDPTMLPTPIIVKSSAVRTFLNPCPPSSSSPGGGAIPSYPGGTSTGAGEPPITPYTPGAGVATLLGFEAKIDGWGSRGEEFPKYRAAPGGARSGPQAPPRVFCVWFGGRSSTAVRSLWRRDLKRDDPRVKAF